MKMKNLLILVLVVASGYICEPSANDRVMKDDSHDEKHYEGEEHNPEYDHEAFLGKDQAKEYDELTPEESKKRLGKLFDKVDGDHDGFVNEKELLDWIVYVQTRDVMKNVEQEKEDTDFNKDGFVEWDEFVKKTQEFLEKHASQDEDKERVEKMFLREQRRFKRADADNNNKLNAKEYYAFLHPENHYELRDLIVEETLEDMDKNKDGFLSLEEFVGDMTSHADHPDKNGPPAWIESEKKQFKEERDKNGDGKLDRAEILDWIVPSVHETGNQDEAKHLLTESDANGDQKISREEMVDKHELFAGSQVTDFGDVLKKHDEF